MSFDHLKMYKNFEKNGNHKSKIISNKFFTFIQIPKTSSTSILYQSEKLKLIKLTFNCYRHEGLLYLENFIDINKPVYTIVRNPFTHILSWFFHCIKNRNIFKNLNLSILEKFNIFVKKYINDVHLRQTDYIKSNKGIKVKIFKFEDYNFINYINKTHYLRFDKYVHKNRNNIKNNYNYKISDYFKNKEIVDLIIKERSKEFKMFNYSTDVSNL